MNNVVLITGASRGIGAATALAAADAGYHVGINYTRDERAAQDVAEQVRAKGVNAAIVKADVANEHEIVDMFKTVRSQLGAVTALVNNAGIILCQASVLDMDAARIERTLAVNVTGAFICAREAIRQMSNAEGGNGGAIVNVSSMAARLGAPNEYVDYAASKGAIDSSPSVCPKRWPEFGIRVNAVRPGVICTDIHATAGEPGRVERVAPSVPMRRGGQPHEVASASCGCSATRPATSPVRSLTPRRRPLTKWRITQNLCRNWSSISKRAGESILKIYETDFKVRGKDDSSPVTDADEQAEAVILLGLERVAPDIAVVAEEGVAAGKVPNISSGRFFLVRSAGRNAGIHQPQWRVHR